MGLGDGLIGFGGGDGWKFGDELAGDGGADDEVAAGVRGAGYAEVGKDGFDFLLDEHSWLVVSVEGSGWLVANGSCPRPVLFCVKSSNEMV